MKRPFHTTIMLLAFLLLTSPASSWGGEKPQLRFVLDLLGTSNFDDISVIKDGLLRSDGMVRVGVIRSAPKFTRLEGFTEETPEHLMSDINGLSQDRFNVEMKRDYDGTLLITLRKLAP